MVTMMTKGEDDDDDGNDDDDNGDNDDNDKSNLLIIPASASFPTTRSLNANQLFTHTVIYF